MTTKIQQVYFICGIISSKIQRRRRPKKMHIIYFLPRFAFNFLADLRVQIRVCSRKSLELSVTIDKARHHKL